MNNNVMMYNLTINSLMMKGGKGGSGEGGGVGGGEKGGGRGGDAFFC